MIHIGFSKGQSVDIAGLEWHEIGRRGITVEPTVKPAKQDLAYMAGFLDGEGTIGIIKQRRTATEKHRYKRKYCYYVYIQITNCSREALEWISERLGGRVVCWSRAHRKVVWSIRWSCRRALGIAKLLRPWLIIKQPQCNLLVEIYEKKIIAMGPGGKYNPDYN
jgi:hypothetical protein